MGKTSARTVSKLVGDPGPLKGLVKGLYRASGGLGKGGPMLLIVVRENGSRRKEVEGGGGVLHGGGATPLVTGLDGVLNMRSVNEKSLSKHRVQVAIHMGLYAMLTQLAIDSERTGPVNLAPKGHIRVQNGAEGISLLVSVVGEPMLVVH
ncbi:MAG: hypothetical protein FRX49_12266 [Trebouxia sp. A1-2]|nr:MAG: hypothetical protein FRX49_12266 [Trebouxia sp. A1-2]